MTIRFGLTESVRRATLALALFTTLPAAATAEEGSLVYVNASGASLLSVIDGQTETALAPIAVAAGAKEFVVSPAGDRVYVRHTGGVITVIDRATDTNIDSFSIAGLSGGLAISPDGNFLYGGVGNTLVIIDIVARSLVAAIPVPLAVGGVVLSPDGATAYVAGGAVAAVDLANQAVTQTNSAVLANGPVVISPDGSKLYLTSNGADIFGGGGSVLVVETATLQQSANIWLGSFPGPLAISPDGARVYVGIQANFVDTGYGAGFFPGRTVGILDAATNTWAGGIDLGADGNNWTQQNTATGIAVAPDRSDVYVSVARLNSVAVANVSTNIVRTRVPTAASPANLVVAGLPGTPWVPYVIDAVDDTAPAPLSADGGTASTNVLVNDRLGGLRATLHNVVLTLIEPLDAGLTLDLASGRVDVVPGASIGDHQITYSICERASPDNCDTAIVRATIRAPYLIDAVDDAGTSVPAGVWPIRNVLANDTLGGVAATTASVTLSTVQSSDPGIVLNSGGTVSIAPNTAYGQHSLVYSICEKASLANCDSAVASVTVVARMIDAVDDAGIVTRSGGVVIADVISNDRFEGLAANRRKISTSLVSSSHPSLVLNVANGSVNVAAGTPQGAHSLRYQICEIARPANCDQANVNVTVQPYLIDAVNDFGRASSKRAGIAIASVLTNDRLGAIQATAASVILSQVSLAPANSAIQLDATDGSVDVLKKTSSATYNLVYQICERANPTNCDQATATIELSGGL